MRYYYRKECKQMVDVRGIRCEYMDVRIDRDTVPKSKFVYEVADGDSDGTPARIRPGILANFYGTLVTDQELTPDEGDTIWLGEGDWKWVPPVKRTFLVQRKFPDGDETTSLMNEHQLISYINMDDCHDEKYELYDVTVFGKVTPCHYTGWQPGCLIEVADENGEILLSGYGEDH